MTTDQYGGGYQPPTGAPTYSDSGTGDQSTTQTAKDQAGNVASTATDQAKNVAGEAKTQARNLMGEAQTQVREQTNQQKQKASGGLRSLSDELRYVADGQGTSQSGIVNDLARQASDKAQELASWLESREPGDLVEDVRSFARRRPGAFLLGAAVAGVVAGRLTRSAVDVKRDQGDDSYTSSYGTAGSSSTAYSSGSTWADASDARGTREGVPTEGVVVEEEIIVAEPYATTPGRGGDVRLRCPTHGAVPPRPSSRVTR